METEVWASELGAESNTFLMVNNSNATVEGSYMIVLGSPERGGMNYQKLSVYYLI